MSSTEKGTSTFFMANIMKTNFGVKLKIIAMNKMDILFLSGQIRTSKSSQSTNDARMAMEKVLGWGRQ